MLLGFRRALRFPRQALSSHGRRYAMRDIDLIIEAGWVVPVEPHAVVLERHAVAVDAGRIVELLPVPEARSRYRAREVVSQPQAALIPGLVNVHTHNPMTLMRGLADDL